MESSRSRVQWVGQGRVVICFLYFCVLLLLYYDTVSAIITYSHICIRQLNPTHNGTRSTCTLCLRRRPPLHRTSWRASFKWFLVRLPSSQPFLTSDHPLGLIHLLYPIPLSAVQLRSFLLSVNQYSTCSRQLRSILPTSQERTASASRRATF